WAGDARSRLPGGLAGRRRLQRRRDGRRDVCRDPGHGRGQAVRSPGRRDPHGPRRQRAPAPLRRPGRDPRHRPAGTRRDGPRLVVATRSEHKLRELRELLHPARATLLTLDEIGVTEEAIEDGETFAANARIKARVYGRLTGLPTLADDSGLEVDALDGG